MDFKSGQIIFHISYAVFMRRETNPLRSYITHDRADALVKAIVFILILVLAYMILKAFNNPSFYVLLFSGIVTVAIFAMLVVHLALISLNGLSVSENHFIPPHEGLPGILSGWRKPVPLDDVAGAELVESPTGRLSFLKVNLLNRNPIVLKKGDYGVNAESFESLVNGVEKRHRLINGR